MTDHSGLTEKELYASFSPQSQLPQDFEDRVMQRIGPAASRSRQQNQSIFLIMALYWSVAAGVAGWLIFEGETTAHGLLNRNLVMMLITIGLSLAPVWLMVRSTRLHLGELFLNTLRR